jgi:hypothetical protein
MTKSILSLACVVVLSACGTAGTGTSTSGSSSGMQSGSASGSTRTEPAAGVGSTATGGAWTPGQTTGTVQGSGTRK